MSGIIKGIGKVFKKVGKFVLKVAPYALAAAAVVFTGGAALGLGFAAGGFAGAVGGFVTGTLGIGGAIGGALTGAVTGAGMGAAVGGVLGGKRGLKQGFIAGGLTGGVLGAVSPASVGIVKDPSSGLWTTKTAIANAAKDVGAAAAKSGAVDAAKTAGLAKNVADGVAGSTPGLVPGVPVGTPPMSPELAGSPAYQAGASGTTAAPTVSTQTGTSGLNAGGALDAAKLGTKTIAPTAPIAAAPPAAINPGQTVVQQMQQAPQAGSGIGGFLGANPALAGNLLTSFGGLLSGGEDSALDVVEAQQQAREDQGEFAYGGAYSGNAKPFGDVNYAPPPLIRGRWYFNVKTNQVEEIPV